MIRAKAGSKEALVFSLLQTKVRGIAFDGKRRFVSENVEISTDESFTHKGVTYLIEVDSGNITKLLVGQYVLLNTLHDHVAEPSFFLVVHTYNGYNVERTLENLGFVNQKLFGGCSIPFGMIHLDKLQAWAGGDVDDLLAMLRVPSLGMQPPPAGARA